MTATETALTRIERIVARVRYKGWAFHVGYGADSTYLQVRFTADGRLQQGRKWLPFEHMTESELVQTALMAVLAAEEHEARENFMYAGKVIYGPHIYVGGLADVCEHLDVRQ